MRSLNRIAAGVLRTHWWVGLFLCLSLLGHANARNILVLSTNSHSGVTADSIDAVNNEIAEFSASGDTVTHMSAMQMPGALTEAYFTAGNYDLVLVNRLAFSFAADNAKVLNDAMQNRWADAFALFYDTGGLSNATAAADLINVLKTAAGITVSASAPITSDVPLELNTNSVYASSFSGAPKVRGGYFFYMNNVPAANVLFLKDGDPMPQHGTLVNNVYTVMIPGSQSYSGKGACIAASADISMFELRNYSGGSNGFGPPNNSGLTNQGKLRPAFNALLSSGGGCWPPVVSKAFSPTSVPPGGVSQLTISVSGDPQGNTTGVNISDTLPAPLVIADNTATHTCTSASAQLVAESGTNSITLTGGVAPPEGCSVTVNVRWPFANLDDCAAPGNVRTNTITPGVGAGFSTDQGQFNNPATATLTCTAGSLTAAKSVVWQAGSVPSDLSAMQFGMNVACTSDTDQVMPAKTTTVAVDAAGAGSSEVTPIVPAGSCVVTETLRPSAPSNHEWVEATLPSTTVTMQAAPAVTTANITNTLRRSLTSIALTKNVVGWPATGTGGSVFNFIADCGPDDGQHSGAVTVAANGSGTGTIANVPQGASCTISEDPGSLPAPPQNYSWGALPASQTIADVQPSSSVSFDNSLSRNRVSIGLTKTVTGGPAAGVTGTFSFEANCGADSNYLGAVALSGTNSGSGSIPNVPQGANCTVSELQPLPTEPTNYTWGSVPMPQPVNNAQASSIASFTNTLTRNITSLALTKTVTGGPSAGVTGTFNFSAACGADGTHSGSVTLNSASTGTGTIADIPAGANCTVTESQALPTAPTNYTWGDVPAEQTVSDMQSTSALTFINPLTRNTATVALTKTVTGGPDAGVSGTFNFTANCGADGSFTGSVALSNAKSGNGAITDIPAGADCTIAEQSTLPIAPDGYYWGTLPPEQPITSVQSSSSVSFENTLSKNAPVAATPIPTLREWALVLMSFMLMGFATLALRQSRTKKSR